MKTKSISLASLVLILASMASVFAFSNELQMQTTNIKLFLNGQRVDKEVYIVGETSYLPVRAISEALNLQVDWDTDNRSINLSQNQSSTSDNVLMNEFDIYEKIEQENNELKQKIEYLQDENNKLNQSLEQTNISDISDNQYSQTTSTQYVSPVVSGEIKDGKIYLKWDPISSQDLKGYKVVISENNSNPKYPNDGYLYWITDRNKNYATIDNSSTYNNGDFGNYLTKSKKYYISVTAVYDDKNIPGNVLEFVYPEY